MREGGDRRGVTTGRGGARAKERKQEGEGGGKEAGRIGIDCWTQGGEVKARDQLGTLL